MRSSYLVLSFILTLGISSFAQSNVVPDIDEFNALKALWDNTNGSAWTNKTNWPTTGNWPSSATATQMDAWNGIVVTNGDITEIQLSGNHLTGTIPSTLSNLSKLVILRIDQNSLTGSIPSSLASLSVLQQLYLSFNSLSGTIPDLSALTELRKLSIGSNGFTAGAIPSWMTSLSKLEAIYLSACNRNGTIPNDIVSLTHLTSLGLGSNSLTGSFPIAITQMSWLQGIDVGINQMSGPLPPQIGDMTGLQQLSINNNAFNGIVPGTLNGLHNLQQVTAYNNSFTGLPTDLTGLTHLLVFLVNNNLIEGTLPVFANNLSTLTRIDLKFNKFTGSIPSSYGNLPNLDHLYLNDNKLSGIIPASLGDTKLVAMLLQNNQLTGSIPPDLGDLTNLTTLYLYGNLLTGGIPSSFSALTKMNFLDVHNNQLSGTIPSIFSGMTPLYMLALQNNKFSGTLPALRGTQIDVSNNMFSGAFPTITAAVPVLIVNASTNSFISFPSAVSTWTMLNTLNLQNNELTSLPSSLSTHSNKTNLVLQVQNNRLDFGTLESFTGFKSGSAVTPQKVVKDQVTKVMTTGSSLVLTARTSGANTTITWEKQSGNSTWTTLTNDQDAVANTYTRTMATKADEGVYRWKSTSTTFSGTTITSDVIGVKTGQTFTLDNWAFQYKYDGRRRMVQKKVPGADWVCMVYDSRDRLVMTQDGEQRKLNKWMVTKYDDLNRPVITSLYTHTGYLSQPGMDSLVSKTNFSETFTPATTTTPGGVLWGYTNTVFPTTSLELLTVTYYDSYNFLSGITGFGYKSDQLTDQYRYNSTNDAAFPRVMGMVTGRRTKTLGAVPYWMLSTNYYDDKGRVLQTVSETYKAGVDRVTSNYDFTGKVMQQRTTHTINNISWQNLALLRKEGNKLVRVPGGSTFGSSGASSVQTIAASTDGWAEGTVTETGSGINRYWGLSDNDSDKQPNTIDYAFYMNGTTLQIVENGVTKFTVTGGEASGDRLRIERFGNLIKYYKNNVCVYPSATTTSAALRIDVSMGAPTATILNLNLSSSKETHSVTREFVYDHAGRLLETWHKIDGNDRILVSKNEYNELGQLIDKKLHSTNATSFRQSIDYGYNIRGWMTSANGVSITNNDSDSRTDLFGMDLFYNETANSPGTNSLFNGNISSMRWTSKSEGTHKGYVFGYDPMNRLTQANYKTKGTSTWQASTSFAEDNLQYDLNGNIKRLHRTNQQGQSMDDLTYDYGTAERAGNRLAKVTDSGDILTGFIDDVKQPEDYTYDNNGNMTADNNKSVSVEYNHLNLPQKVSKPTGEQIQYFYTSDGAKVSQLVLNTSGIQTKSTDYEGEYIYENDTLKFINTEEGRVVMTSTQPEYQYHLKDHLGNVRMTFTTKDEKATAKATLETENATAEGGEFLNYGKARRINHPVFDHTYDSTTPPNGTTYATRLNGSENERIGLAKSLSVMAGDTLKIEVFAKYYEQLEGQNPGAFVTLMAAIIGGTPPSGTFVDGSDYATNWTTTVPGSGLLDKSGETGTPPKAYLNWLVFDRDYNLVLSKSGYKRITTTAKEDASNVAHERLAPNNNIVIDQAGYAYIYLSNENETKVEVYFDDFKVEHVKSPVIESQDYYPFGLTFNNYRRENSLTNRKKFQGQEHIDELGLNWDGFKWRNHQPDIGRFFNLDPLSEEYYYNSPYAFSENKVISHRELEGLESDPVNKEEDRDKPVPTTRAAQSTTASASATMGRSAQVRRQYVNNVSKLDPTDTKGRTAAKVEARAKTPAVMREVAERMRPMTNEASRAGGTASKTNAGVNRTVGAMGTAGQVAGGVSLGISIYNVATADNKPQAVAREGGALAGAIAGGEAGAEVGAGIGALFGGAGAVPGAIIGGVVGSIGGGIVGAMVGESVYEAETKEK